MNFQLRRNVWQAARIPNDYRYSPSLWRIDAAGRLIYWFAFGDKQHANGWDVAHVVAKSDGGTDDLSNLQVEHHRTSNEKQQAMQVLKNWKRYDAMTSMFTGDYAVRPFLETVRPN